MSEQPRIAPAEQGKWTEEQIRAVDAMMPPPGTVYAERRKKRGGAGGNQALSLMVRNPALAKAFMTFNRHILYENSIDVRTRELAVLRVSWVLRSPYEWGQHALVAEESGVTAEEIDRCRMPADTPGWDAHDAAVIKAVDDLLGGGDIDDESWAVLHERWGDEGMLDFIHTVGCYTTVGMVFNATRLPLDEGMTGFPGDD